MTALPENPHNLEGFYSGYVVTNQTGKRFNVPMTQLEVRKSSDKFIVLNIWEMGPIHVANITIGDQDTTITRPGVVRKIILAQITNMKFAAGDEEVVISYSIEQMYLENKYIELDVYTSYYRLAQVPVSNGERVLVDENNFLKQSWTWAIINGVHPEDFTVEAGLYYTTRGAVSNTVEFKTAQTFLDFSKVDVDEETGESPFKGTGTVYVYLNIISNDYTKADSAIVLSMQSLNDNPSFWTYYRRIGTLTFKDWVVTDLTQDNIGKPTVIGYYVRDTYAFRTTKVVSYAEGKPGKPVYRIDVRGGNVSLGIHSYSVEAKSYKLDKEVAVSYYGGLFSSYNLPNAAQGEEVISESGSNRTL